MAKWYDPWGLASNTYHFTTGRPTAEESRNQKNEMNEQMRLYREQTELTQKAINEARDQKAAEKKRISEKQIRHLRGNFRAPSGFLNQSNSSLGASADLPTKLGA